MARVIPPTCDRFAADWPELFPRPDAATNANHRSMIRRFGITFAGRRLDEIDRVEARRWAMKHPRDLRYVRAMYADAIDCGIVAITNPFAGLRVRPPTSPDVEIPTLDELLELVDAARDLGDHALQRMIGFAAYTGLRLGEMLALTLDDITAGGTRVSVTRQIHRGQEKPPKGGHERMSLIPDPAPPVPGVRPGERLWPLSASAHYKRWVAVREAVGVTYRWHSLRHFCATYFLDLGATAEDVAIQLGHRDGGELVRRRYGHADKDLALDRLAALAK